MAAVEIGQNPLLAVLRPDGALVAAIEALAPYDALLVPEYELFERG